MGQFTDAISTAMGGTIPGAIFGIALGGYNDRRQREQQEDLQRIQIRGNKEMMDYSMMKQLEMWKATNYRAQMAELKAAGLNPALLYGMKGGGGVTVGSPSGGVSGGNAPVGGGEIPSMMGMGMQLQLLKAQKENIEANTAKTQAEAEKTAGVDTGLARTQIMLNTAGVETEFAKQGLIKIQTELGNIDKEIQGRSIEASVRYIDWAAEKLWGEVQDWRYRNNISDETWKTKVHQIQADLFGTWLRNALTQSQTTKTEAEIRQIHNSIVQRWEEISTGMKNATTNQRRQQHDAWLNDVQKSTGLPMEILEEAVDGIFRNMPRTRTSTREGMKDKEGGYWEQRTERY